MKDYIIYKENEYMEVKIDTDRSRYLDIKNDVEMYTKGNDKIDQILEKYRNKINEDTYYIKGAYLFFTIENVKYWTKISHHIDEENYINEIVNELNLNGCKRVMYKYGELD